MDGARGDCDIVVYDQGPQFDSDVCRAATQRLGMELEMVPRESHWPNLAEIGIKLLRQELKRSKHSHQAYYHISLLRQLLN